MEILIRRDLLYHMRNSGYHCPIFCYNFCFFWACLVSFYLVVLSLQIRLQSEQRDEGGGAGARGGNGQQHHQVRSDVCNLVWCFICKDSHLLWNPLVTCEMHTCVLFSQSRRCTHFSCGSLQLFPLQRGLGGAQRGNASQRGNQDPRPARRIRGGVPRSRACYLTRSEGAATGEYCWAYIALRFRSLSPVHRSYLRLPQYAHVRCCCMIDLSF